MDKKEILKEIYKNKEIFASRAFKSEFFLINDNEFDKLKKHLDLEYSKCDTIIIGNYIFKK